jgi:hypothetical protein
VTSREVMIVARLRRALAFPRALRDELPEISSPERGNYGRLTSVIRRSRFPVVVHEWRAGPGDLAVLLPD